MNDILDEKEVLEPCEGIRHCLLPRWLIDEFVNDNLNLTNGERDMVDLALHECIECYDKLKSVVNNN